MKRSWKGFDSGNRLMKSLFPCPKRLSTINKLFIACVKVTQCWELKVVRKHNVDSFRSARESLVFHPGKMQVRVKRQIRRIQRFLCLTKANRTLL